MSFFIGFIVGVLGGAIVGFCFIFFVVAEVVGRTLNELRKRGALK